MCAEKVLSVIVQKFQTNAVHISDALKDSNRNSYSARIRFAKSIHFVILMNGGTQKDIGLH